MPEQSLSKSTDAIVGNGDASRLPVSQRAVTRPQSDTGSSPAAAETATQDLGPPPPPVAAPVPVFTPQNSQVTNSLILHNHVKALGYELNWQEGLLPGPSPQWKALVLIDKVAFCEGVAQSKQSARQDAAGKTLEYLKSHPYTLQSRRPAGRSVDLGSLVSLHAHTGFREELTTNHPTTP